MGKYELLRRCLENQQDEQLTLSFDAIADIIGDELPDSSRRLVDWWANDPEHAEAGSWLEAGYQSACVSLSSESVTFIRV